MGVDFKDYIDRAGFIDILPEGHMYILIFPLMYNAIVHLIVCYFIKIIVYIHSTKKGSSRLTLFDKTREIVNQICLFKMYRMQNFSYAHLSGHSLSTLTIAL